MVEKMMFDLLSFFIGVITAMTGFFLGVMLKIHKDDILYSLLHLIIKEDRSLKIKDMPIDNNVKK
jgi:hypothetical protein